MNLNPNLQTIVFYTLGCKANQYQSFALQCQMTNDKCQMVDFGQPADIYVINTCTVTEDADRKSRQAIRRALRLAKKVIVSGCYAKMQREDLSKMFPEIEFIFLSPFNPCSSLPIPRIRANLMIQDGCDHFCSYCIVPYARGKVASKPLEQAVEEAKLLVAAGAREIVLTGINLGTYPFLSSLVHRLSSLKNLLRIRLSSIEPMYLTKELVDAVASTPKVCHHLHIPLQSGDNYILKAMNRNYTVEGYFEMIKYIREKIPDCGVTTDILIGFPGEGEKEFQNTLDLVNKIKFSRLHIFTFSKRKGTLAADFPAQVDTETKKRRSKILHKLKTKHMLEFASQYLDKEVEILVEQKGEGLTSNYMRILYYGDESEVGDLKKVIIKEVKEEYCIAV